MEQLPLSGATVIFAQIVVLTIVMAVILTTSSLYL